MYIPSSGSFRVHLPIVISSEGPRVTSFRVMDPVNRSLCHCKSRDKRYRL